MKFCQTIVIDFNHLAFFYHCFQTLILAFLNHRILLLWKGAISIIDLKHLLATLWGGDFTKNFQLPKTNFTASPVRPDKTAWPCLTFVSNDYTPFTTVSCHLLNLIITFKFFPSCDCFVQEIVFVSEKTINKFIFNRSICSKMLGRFLSRAYATVEILMYASVKIETIWNTVPFLWWIKHHRYSSFFFSMFNGKRSDTSGL